jgi:AhpD family alkylhydroperoxidase
MELEDIVEILKNDPDKAVTELIEDVRKQYGEVPYITNFMKDFPEIFIPKTIYDNSVMRGLKSLDPNTVELISIGVASALRCDHCLKMHIRVAKRRGINKESIFYAIMIGASLANAAVLAESTRALASEFPDENDDSSDLKGRNSEHCYDPNCEICNISRDTLE